MKLKNLKYLFVFSFIFVSCKTKKNIIDSSVIAKEMSAKKVARKHVAANFNKKTINAKLKVNFDNGRIKQNISVNMKIKKDAIIWLKGSKFITLFKAKITPTSVRYYSPFFKNYFEGDFSMLKKLLGVEINFKQLQNLLLGQSLLNVKKEKQNIVIRNNSYVLSPKKQSNLFNVFFAINPSHFKLDKQSVVNPIKNERLDIFYPSYHLVDKVVFPSEIKIKAKRATSFTNIDLIVKSVKFNTDINTDFSISKKYKRMIFK